MTEIKSNLMISKIINNFQEIWQKILWIFISTFGFRFVILTFLFYDTSIHLKNNLSSITYLYAVSQKLTSSNLK